jgi:Spy/CpxP family protein refolding chaperone
MKTKLTLLALTLGASTCVLTAQDGPPPSDTQSPPQHAGGPGGGPGAQRGFHLLPPRAQDLLKLTDDQKTQIAALEAETKAKLEKILTSDQLEQLKNLRPPMRPGGPGNPGGPQMRGGPGGPGGNSGGGNNPPPGPPPGEQ